MKPILSVGVVVLSNQNQVLLVKHGSKAQHLTGLYGLPAGKVELGETLADAASRELFEETGLVIPAGELHKLPDIFFATIEQKDGLHTFEWHIFVSKFKEGSLEKTEETEPVWITPEEMQSLPLLPNVLEAVEKGKELVTR